MEVNKRRTVKANEASFHYEEEEKMNENRLRNRMKICSLSVCLMWASSLRTASFISSYAVQVPPLSVAYETCKSSTQVILEEESGFTQCVERQLEQCEKDLNTAIDLESKRVRQISTRNSKILNNLREVAMNCTEVGASLQKSLDSWLSVSQEIPEKNNTCSTKDREAMFSTIYDISVLRSEAISISSKYSDESAMIMGNVVDYTKRRIGYDRNYASSYVHDFELEAMNYIRRISLPTLNVSIEFQSIAQEIERLMDCSTLHDIPYLSCDEFFPDIKFGGHWKHQTDAMLDKWLLMADRYKRSHREMMLRTDAFFQLAKGAESKFLQYWNSATDVWKYEVGGFTKWVMKGVLDCNGCTGKTLGRAYDSVRKAWKSELPALSDVFPLQNIDLIDNIEGQFLNEYSKVTAKFKVMVETSHEQFKEGWESSLSETADIVEAMESTVMAARSSLMRNVSILPADYNPPQYVGANVEITDLDKELEHFGSMSKAFLVDSEDTINNVADASNTTDTQKSFIFEPTKVNMTAIQSNLRGFDITFERLTSPGIAFDIWFLKFSSISDLLYLIDYAFRIFFTIRMCYKYWRVSEVQIPKVDIRTQKEITNPFRMSNGRLITSVFTNPLIGAFLGSIIALATVATVMSVYLPLFSEYRNGCIPYGTNGTFIGQNVYSSAYNFAYQEGSSSLLKGKKDLDIFKTDIYTSLHVSSVKKYNEHLANSASNSQIITRVGNQIGTLERCIDTDISDQEYIQACCGHAGYGSCINGTLLKLACPLDLRKTPAEPYSPPGGYISRKACDINLESVQWQPKEAVFEFSTLPECGITCPGPHKDRLRQITKECSCFMEWFVHSLLLRGLLSLLIFALMNLSRTIFINGLGKVVWRRLHPGTFSVWATCDETGTIITKLESDNDSKERVIPDDQSKRNPTPTSVVRDIKKTLEWNSFMFRLSGHTAILMATLMNLSWIILVVKAPDATKMKWL